MDKKIRLNSMPDQKIIFSHIAAVSQNNVIGLKNKLPWHIPEDLRYFFNTTKNKALIMGRKTFESLGKPLKGRLHAVVSQSPNFLPEVGPASETFVWGGGGNPALKSHSDISLILKKSSPVVICPSIKKAMDFCSHQEVLEKYGSEIFITGGGEIYKQTLSLADRLYITRIHQEYEGDAFYPAIPRGQFKEISRTDRTEPAPLSFLIYEKIP